MPIKRMSLCEVQMNEVIYSFIDSNESTGFLACLLTEPLKACEAKHPPLSKLAFRTGPDDFEPGA